MHAGSYPDGISLRILFDTTTEILLAAAAHGTFNLHRIAHVMKPFNRAAYLPPGNHKSSVRRAGRHKSLRTVIASAVTQKTHAFQRAIGGSLSGGTPNPDIKKPPQFRNAWVRGSNPLCAPKKSVKANTYVPLVFWHDGPLWPVLYPHNAWVGTANPLRGTIKISKGKHIRDARVLARGFAVAIFVLEHAWVGSGSAAAESRKLKEAGLVSSFFKVRCRRSCWPFC